jgi:WD40 repeat protein
VILGRAVGPASVTAEEPKPKTILRGHEDRVCSVAFSPDGKTLASAGYDDSATVWNLATGEKVSSLSAKEHEARSVAYSPDGRTNGADNSRNS